MGRHRALLGTNPIAVAIPADQEPAVVMDMAPTVAAFGKVRLKAALGEPMPVGWMIDRAGHPLTDAKRAGEGFLLPIGDYKGYALLTIGLLAGTLNQAAFGRDIVDFLKHPDTATNTGQSILAVRVDAFCPVDVFKRNVDATVRTIRELQRLPGFESAASQCSGGWPLRRMRSTAVVQSRRTASVWRGSWTTAT